MSIIEQAIAKITDKQRVYNENRKQYWVAEQAAKKEYEKQARKLDARIAQAQALADAANADKEKAEAKATELRKKLSMSNPAITEFKTQFEQVQTWANKCIATIDKFKAEDEETADKLTAAMTAFLAQMLDKIKED